MRHITAGLCLAGALSLFATAAWAQQPPLPPGSPLIGRPDNNAAAAKLAPVPSPPLPTPADKVPVDQLKAPRGFNIELYASGMANARSMALGAKGTVFVGSRLQDKVYAIVNKNGKREAKVLVSGLYRPNGVAFKDGTLYIAELSQTPRSRTSKTSSTHRRSPRSSTAICRRTRRTAGNIWPSDRTTSCISRSASRATTSRMTRPTASSAASISMAAAPRSSPTASATPWGSTGIRETMSSTSRTTAAIGCPKTCPTINSIGSPRSARTSASRFAIRVTFPTSNSAGAIAAANSCRRSPSWGRTQRRSA